LANQVNKAQTGMLDIGAASLPPTDVVPASNAPANLKPIEINLVIGEKRPFKRRRILLRSEIIIGRVDDETVLEQFYFDLTAYDAANKGVSRKHAVLRRHEFQVFVEDLNSTNGTRINGYQIHPNQPYRLRNGDELEFGLVRVVVNFRE